MSKALRTSRALITKPFVDHMAVAVSPIYRSRERGMEAARLATGWDEHPPCAAHAHRVGKSAPLRPPLLYPGTSE